MVKKESKACNFRLKAEVVWALEDLATQWGVSQTEAVTRAILDVHGSISGAVSDLGAMVGAGAVGTAVKGVAEPISESTFENECVHCQKTFRLVAGRPPSTLCPQCFRDGHRNVANCYPCGKADWLAKKRAEDKTAVAAGNDSVDYDVDWGA